MRAHCERKSWIFKVFGSGAGLCQSNFTRIGQPHASFLLQRGNGDLSASLMLSHHPRQHLRQMHNLAAPFSAMRSKWA
jgi:hypothetical protein